MILSSPKWRQIKALLINTLPPQLVSNIKRKYYAQGVLHYSEQDFLPIRYLVRPGDTVLDIGANFGWYTRLLSELVSANGRVYSIEPFPPTFSILQGVIERLGLFNVTPMNCGISEKNGEAVMEVPMHESSQVEDLYRAKICNNDSQPEDQSSRMTVTLSSLDSLFITSTKNITFIKCDVEGHELSVIRGGSEVIRRSKPAWLLEVSGNPDDSDSSAYVVLGEMAHHGYTPYWFDGKVIRKRRPGDEAVNYFFLQHSHVEALRSMIPC